MNITKQQLKQIIKEELEAVLSDSLSEEAADYKDDSVMLGKVKVIFSSKASGGSKNILVVSAETMDGNTLFTHDIDFCDELKGCGPLIQSYKQDVGAQDILHFARKSGAELQTMKLLKKLLA